jgi:hypothetical protein
MYVNAQRAAEGPKGTFSPPDSPALMLTAAWTMGGIVLFLLAPLTTPLLVVLSFVAPFVWLSASQKRTLWHTPTPVFIALYLAVAYLALNMTWAPDRSTAAMTVGLIVVLVTAVDVSLVILRRSALKVLDAIAIGFIIGVVIGGLYLCFEVLSDQWIRRTLAAYQPWLRPTALHTRVTATGVLMFEPHILNQSITAVTMALWPSSLAIKSLNTTRSWRGPLLVGLLPAVVAILRSEHATSKLALFGSAAIFLLYQARPGFARLLTTTGWVVATLLVVPIALVLFTQHMYTATWLFPSAQQRIVIWGHTSKQVAKVPLLGVGVAATRTYHTIESRANAPLAPGSQFPLEIGWHSHNIFLQIWYETGAVGALFLLAIGVLIGRSFAAVPTAAQPFLWSTFATCALIGASSFSLWAPWFMAAFGLTAIFAGLGVALLPNSQP